MFITRMFRNFSSKHKILQNIKISIKSSSSTLYKNSASNAIRPYGTFGDQTGRFLKPTNDIAFKRIFGLERNKNLLIDFLNSILLVLDRSPISEVQILSSNLEPEIVSKNQYISNLLCKDSTGAYFILEPQTARQRGFEKRVQYYAANVYKRKFDRSRLYLDLREVLFIGITNFVLIPNSPDFLSIHTTRDRKANQEFLSDLSYIFIELPKFNKNRNKVDSIINKWIYFLKYAHDTKEEDVEMLFKGTFIQKAFEELNPFNWSSEELFAYDNENMIIWNQEATLEAAREDGVKAGKEEGKKEGKEEGKKEGLKAAVKAVALSMMERKMPFPLIMDVTGLTIEELIKLKGCSSETNNSSLAMPSGTLEN